MRTQKTRRTLGLVLCAAFALAACGGREERAAAPPEGATPPVAAAPAAAPLRVGAIQVGAAIDAAKRVTAPQSTFAPGDTIYASVETQGVSPGATLTARWLYGEGQLVNESSQTLTAGENVSEFHISKPNGWPAGSYRVEILAGGRSVGTRTFEVR
jgi:hypothetical protein